MDNWSAIEGRLSLLAFLGNAVSVGATELNMTGAMKSDLNL